MFCTGEKDSELRLIDFGSGTMDGLEGSERGNSDSNVDDTDRHHTFAGKPVFRCAQTCANLTDVVAAALLMPRTIGRNYIRCCRLLAPLPASLANTIDDPTCL